MKNSTLSISNDDAFRSFVMVSATLHVSFFVFFAVKSFLGSSDVIEIPPSVRVDMVALPDKLPENPAPINAPVAKEPPQPEPKVEAPPKPEPVNLKPAAKEAPAPVKNVKETQKKALEKLKAMDALEKIKNEVAAKNQAKPLQPKAQTRQALKGNIISSGNSFTGLSRLRVNEYLENLTALVRDRWVLPQFLSSDNLKAAVVIAIDSRGQITRKEIYASSGNSIFDSSCLAAVTDAAPFDPPPEEVEDALIMIRFPFQ